jgi:hypothetical protein
LTLAIVGWQLLGQSALATTYHVPGDFDTIQGAIDKAAPGDWSDWANPVLDTILVGPGTYVENLVIRDKTVILRSTAGAEVTIIDGGAAGSVLQIDQSSNSGGAITTRPTIEGFTLTNGNASAGGGIYVARYADPTFRRLVIRGNRAAYGGGVYNGIGVCFAVFEDTLIADNHADWYGGGIYGVISCTTLRNSQLTDNSAGQGGGGGVASVGFCTGFGAFDSVIADNTTGGTGGGLYNVGSSSCGASVRASNSLLVRNEAAAGGGVWVGYYGYAGLDFTTVANNTATLGGGFYGEDYGASATTQNPSYQIANSILYHNSSLPVLPTYARGGTYMNMNLVAGSDVEGCIGPDYLGWETTICADPLFADPDNGDYRLLPGSPAIDLAVTAITLPNGGTLQVSVLDHDILGNPRPEGDGYDAGAYEFSLPLIDALVDLDPNTLNLNSNGNWITGYITLPASYDPRDVIVESVMIDQSIPAVRGEVQDGVLMVKFDRDALASYLAGADGNVTLTVSGIVADVAIFQGSDTIRVKALPPNRLSGAERIQAIGTNAAN